MTWPTLDCRALHGLIGDVVDTIGPESEADPAAIAATFLACFGNAVGPGPHARAGGAAHPARLNVLVVGETARSRKGTSWADTRPVLAAADPQWCSTRILSGFGSGEAVIDAVRDPSDDDPGVEDKRALIREGEFVRILRVAKRETSTLGSTMRDFWDGEPVASRTVGRGTKTASRAHVSVVAHVTSEELHRELLGVDVWNGFANRFLPVCARRSKRLPSGGNLDDHVVASLGDKTARRLQDARSVGIMRRTREAEHRWDAWYRSLSDDVHGMFGAVTARAEAQVLRLSVAYALTDGVHQIDIPHLEAALALWDYVEASARHLFSSSTGDIDADRLLDALIEAAPAGLDGKQVSGLFSGHRTAKQLELVREHLVALGLAEIVTDRTGPGRPRVFTFACELSEEANEGSSASSLSSPRTEAVG